MITSIEFVKELCAIAKDTVKAEKELQEKSPKAALTELFLELKTDETPAVVERIVTDIDAIVRVVNFLGWQNTVGGEREVQKSLRKALLKYKLHKDQVLFDRVLGDPLIIQVSQQCEPTLCIHALPSVNAALLFDSFPSAEPLSPI